MTLKRLAVICICIATVVLLCTMVCHRSVSVEGVQQRLAVRLRPGFTPDQVDGALATLGMEPGEVLESHAWSDTEPALGPWIMRTLIRDSSACFPTKGDIQADFYFDRQKRLTTWRVKEVYTGP